MARSIIIIKNNDDLRQHIAQEIATHGNACDLNHLDVSCVQWFDHVFQGSPFVGNISQWDVSNASSMTDMFRNAMFNGDISQWRIPNTKYLTRMFYGSELKSDLSAWRIRVDGFYKPLVHAEFSGKLPRVLYDNPHESYQAMFTNKENFIEYARRMPFFGMHADLLIADPKKCFWAGIELLAWAKEHIDVSNALGMGPDAVRASMLASHHAYQGSIVDVGLPADFLECANGFD